MAVEAARTGWSADGNWFWTARSGTSRAEAEVALRRNTWQPFAGQRSAMPGRQPRPPSPTTRAFGRRRATADTPSWVDLSNRRIAREKRARGRSPPNVARFPEQLRHAASSFERHTATVRSEVATRAFSLLGTVGLAPAALI